MLKSAASLIGLGILAVLLLAHPLNSISAQTAPPKTPTMPNCRHLAADMNVVAAEWSPDAKQIAFATRDEVIGKSSETQSKLWLVNTDGTALQQLWQIEALYEWIDEIRWSPDGKQLALHLIYDSGEQDFTSHMYLMDMHTKAAPMLYYSAGRSAANPSAYFSWSPDSRHLVFRFWRGAFNLVRLDTYQPPEIAASTLISASSIPLTVVWADDSKHVTVVAPVHGNKYPIEGLDESFWHKTITQYQLTTLSIDGNYEFGWKTWPPELRTLDGEPPQLGATLTPSTYDAAFDNFVEIIPGRRYVAFTGNRHIVSPTGQPVSQSGLFVFRLSGEEVAFIADAWGPNWFPDGHRLFFKRSEPASFNERFFTVDMDHPNDITQLTFGDSAFNPYYAGYYSNFTALQSQAFGFTIPPYGIYTASTESPCIIYQTR